VKTKKCTIVDKKPAASEATVVSPDGAVYKTRTEAENAMKTVKVLHDFLVTITHDGEAAETASPLHPNCGSRVSRRSPLWEQGIGLRMIV
jgi:hypothetical protein